MSRHRARRAAGPVTLAAAMVAVGAGTAVAAASPGPPPPAANCPALMVFNIEGTSEISMAANPDVTTGTLSSTAATATATGQDIQTRTIPYAASFGGAPGTGPGTATLAASASDAVNRLNSQAAQVVSRCSQTRIAVAGYSQGAIVASQWAQQIAASGDSGPVPADRVAGVALLSDGSRPAGPDPFPGNPGRVHPAPPPGVDGPATSRISMAPPPPSAGIAPAPTGTNWGSLSGRVAEYCAPGDLACDAPPDAAALRTAASIAARADLRDPIAAATSIIGALQQTLTTATTTAVLDDIHLDRGTVSYAPAETLSDRIANAADPRTPAATPAQVQAAGDKFGRVVAAVAADPLRQLPALAGQIGAAVAANAAANANVLSPQAISTYVGAIGHHDSYGRPGGAAQQAGAWFGALSHDIGGSR